MKSSHRTLAAVAVASLAASALYGAAIADRQPDQRGQLPGMSVSLLQRLARAADGYLGADSVWFVADSVFPHTVVGGFDNLDDAQRALAGVQVRSPGAWGIFGPLYTAARQDDSWLFPCPHQYPTEYCPDTLPTPIDKRDVARIVLYVEGAGGELLMADTMSNDVDAIFLTWSALEGFVQPRIAASGRTQYGLWERLEERLRAQMPVAIR